MNSRWIFKEEFVALLKLAGFQQWQVFGSPEGEALSLSERGALSYWIIESPSSTARDVTTCDDQPVSWKTGQGSKSP